MRRTVNYGDAAAGGKEMDDGSWQDNLSDYNSDFSMPSDQEDGNYIYFFKLHFNYLPREVEGFTLFFLLRTNLKLFYMAHGATCGPVA